jgi:hypothetical protein
MQPDTSEVNEHGACHASMRCESQQLLAWWAKLVHRILVQEAMKASWENRDERQDTIAASEASGLRLRSAIDSDAGLCQHRVDGTAIRLG